jgi:porphobilinogen deaminase
LKADDVGEYDEAEALGIRVAEELIAQGAKELLAQASL